MKLDTTICVVYVTGLTLCGLGYVVIFQSYLHPQPPHQRVVVHEFVQQDRFDYKGPVRGEPNIMFVETTCVSVQQRHRLSARQACTVSSAARAHPDHTIHLFHTCKSDHSRLLARHPDPYMRQLLRHDNVYLTYMNATKMVAGSPLEQWWKTQPFRDSEWPIHHASDALRLLLLWKYGGIYIDLDFIIVRTLSETPNFVGLEVDNQPGSSLVGLEATDWGRGKTEELMGELVRTYSPHLWSYNGPGLFKRVMTRYCRDLDLVAESEKNICNGITILPRSRFFPFWFLDAAYLFHNEDTIVSWLWRDEGVRAVHLWNHQSQDLKVNVGSSQIYAVLAEKFCPTIYANSGEQF